MGSQANRPAKITNYVDSLIEEDHASELKAEKATSTENLGSNDAKLVSLMGRFESKIKAGSDLPGVSDHVDDLDGDDESFKKPA